jgi:hypothetical protein
MRSCHTCILDESSKTVCGKGVHTSKTVRDSFTFTKEKAHSMRELWKEVDCEVSKAEPQRIKNKEEANQKTSKSDKEPENIDSAKGSEGIWG